MPEYLQVQIPKACDQSWDEMNAGDKGRFCNSCKKNVIDFTLMSDSDIANYLRRIRENVCGRFTQDQLNRDIRVPSRKIPWLKYFFQIAFPAFLFSLKSSGQTQRLLGKVLITAPQKQIQKEELKNIDTSRIVSGKVIVENGKPLAGISIRVKSTSQGVVTDTSGSFIIKIEPGFTTLVFSGVGFDGQERDFSNHISEAIIMKVTTQYLGGLVIAGGISGKTRKSKTKFKPLIPAASINSFTIFPNPATCSSKLNIEWKDGITCDQTAEIYNQSGHLLQQEIFRINKRIDQQNFDLRQLIPGTYIIKISDNKTHKFSSQKFIVQ